MKSKKIRIRIDYIKKELINDDILNEKFNEYVQDFRSEKEALYCLTHYDDSENHKCPICGNLCEFYINVKRSRYEYRKSCGNEECINKLIYTDEMFQKMRNTIFNKYGVKNVMELKSMQIKGQNTTFEHFGVLHPSQNDEIKQKTKNAFLNKYNTENPSKLKENRKKAELTTIKKFGVKNGNQRHILHYDIYFDDEKFKQFIIDEHDRKNTFLIMHDICVFFNIKQCTLKKRLKKLNLLNYFYIQQSNLEIDFESFLNANNIKFKKDDKSVLHDNNTNERKEIDFLCGSIGFEINDIITHNSYCENKITYKDPLYHQQKSLLAREKDIQLIHIWEWEMRNEKTWNKLSKWILDKLNNNKIKLTFSNIENLKEIEVNEEKIFLELYDLDGYTKSDVCLGFYDNNELIQLLSFKKINDQNYQLLRICTKFGYLIINVKNEIKEIMNLMKIKYLVCECNIDKDDLKWYKEIGFKKIEMIPPKITWCDKNMNISDHQKPGYVPIYNAGYIKCTI